MSQVLLVMYSTKVDRVFLVTLMMISPLCPQWMSHYLVLSNMTTLTPGDKVGRDIDDIKVSYITMLLYDLIDKLFSCIWPFKFRLFYQQDIIVALKIFYNLVILLMINLFLCHRIYLL